MTTVCVAAIRLYQLTLSPDHSWIKVFFPQGYCRFHPSCSMYTIDAIRKYGPAQGIVLGMKRIGRCAPWNPGGYDPA